MPAEQVALVVAAIALVAGLVAWVGLPLWRGDAGGDVPDPRVVALLAEREATLAALRDLDADHADGRVTDADYAALRAEAVARGAAALDALDALARDAAGRNARLLEAVEREVAALAERGDP